MIGSQSHDHRRKEILVRLDQLRKEIAGIGVEIGDLEIELAAMEAGK